MYRILKFEILLPPCQKQILQILPANHLEPQLPVAPRESSAFYRKKKLFHKKCSNNIEIMYCSDPEFCPTPALFYAPILILLSEDIRELIPLFDFGSTENKGGG